jgi:outer membrane protein OmpA-like peptidoglycan-associated protein
MQIDRLVTTAIALAATTAFAQPSTSQHPRAGKLAELTFAPGSNALTAGEETRIGQIAAWAFEYPDGIIELDSFADPTGSLATNQQLSLRRAETIRGLLVELGVDPDRIVVSAYGERGIGKRRVVVTGRQTGSAIATR